MLSMYSHNLHYWICSIRHLLSSFFCPHLQNYFHCAFLQQCLDVLRIIACFPQMFVSFTRDCAPQIALHIHQQSFLSCSWIATVFIVIISSTVSVVILFTCLLSSRCHRPYCLIFISVFTVPNISNCAEQRCLQFPHLNPYLHSARHYHCLNYRRHGHHLQNLHSSLHCTHHHNSLMSTSS